MEEISVHWIDTIKNCVTKQTEQRRGLFFKYYMKGRCNFECKVETNSVYKEYRSKSRTKFFDRS